MSNCVTAIQPHVFVPRATDSRHAFGDNNNLLLDASPPTSMNHVWVGDVTSALLMQGGAYLASFEK